MEDSLEAGPARTKARSLPEDAVVGDVAADIKGVCPAAWLLPVLILRFSYSSVRCFRG